MHPQPNVDLGNIVLIYCSSVGKSVAVDNLITTGEKLRVEQRLSLYSTVHYRSGSTFMVHRIHKAESTCSGMRERIDSIALFRRVPAGSYKEYRETL